MTELEVKLIKLDGGTQARAGIDRETVNEYVEALRESDSTWPFPPVIVYHDGDAYWLADGFHRITAARQHGRFVCDADVRQGTQRDAILHAAGANAEHGLRRTPEDKRRAVLRLLEDAEWGRWSDREIARRCKVSHPFVAKIREETGNITSERVYTNRHGNEAVMETASIGSKPRPNKEDMRARLRQSLHDEMYAGYQATGITDSELRQVLSRDWGLGGGSAGPNMTEVYRKGGSDPSFWYNKYRDSGKPTLRGKELIDLVRDVLELPYPQETAVSQPKRSPFYVGEDAQQPEIRPALDGYLRRTFSRASLPAIIEALINRAHPDSDFRLNQASQALGTRPGHIRNAALVLKSNHADYQERAETAVSAPESITQQIITDVEVGYEKEWESAAPASRPHADTRLANLNGAISTITSLTVDKSLTIDIVGPLARALGLMEDAKKALTKRQAYATWLRDYQGDDGRTWSELTDSQTWHKNSPCCQAFMAAFPDEDFVKSALMDARQQLERETAVAQEVDA